MIVLEDVSKSYSTGSPAIKNISLKIEEGEFVFIVGNSGSGKSTLIKLLLKELEPTSGKIFVNGKDLNTIKRKKIPEHRRGIGVVFQDFRLLKDRNVYDNIAFAQRVIETPVKDIKKRVPAMLALVGLAEKYRSFPKELSGGEQQRVALARALVNKPTILLADEPTGNLDPKNSWEIMKLLEEINKGGTTVVVVTHNREIVDAMNKRVITMHKGVILSDEKKVNIHMKVSTLAYSCGQGIKNIKRNKLFSLASVGTITACIFLIGLFYIIIANFQYLVKEAEDSVCITVFFDDDITEKRIQEIGEQLGNREEVSEIKYTSADEAWADYKERYFAEEPDLAEGFRDDNPLAGSSNYEIYLKDLKMQDAFVTYLKTISGIRKVNYSENTANTLTDFAKVVGYVSISIIVILFAVGIFLISNTVMIGITVRKEEIRIMKLIGATDIFVRLPFVIEGVIIGLIGAILPIIALVLIYQKVIVYLMTQFQSFTSIVTFISARQIFSVVIPMALLIGAGIGLIGSKITIRKHLKV